MESEIFWIADEYFGLGVWGIDFGLSVEYLVTRQRLPAIYSSLSILKYVLDVRFSTMTRFDGISSAMFHIARKLWAVNLCKKRLDQEKENLRRIRRWGDTRRVLRQKNHMTIMIYPFLLPLSNIIVSDLARFVNAITKATLGCWQPDGLLNKGIVLMGSHRLIAPSLVSCLVRNSGRHS
jgi:hypothetical protein